MNTASLRFLMGRALDRKGTRRLLRVAATWYARSIREREVDITHEDGRWVHRHPDGTIVNLHVDTVPPAVWRRETEEQFLYRYQPRPGDVIIDVGAGIGRETFALAPDVGRHGRVIAFEAHPAIHSCLRKMCLANGLDNVETFQIALVDSDGSFRLSDRKAHLANTLHLSMQDDGVVVPGRALDSLAPELELESIDFIKMNVEGGEVTALAGMNEVLGRTQQIAVECHDFIAEATGDERFRTMDRVRGILEGSGFDVVHRAGDSRPWVASTLYGVRPG